MNNLIIFFLGLVLGVIANTFFILYLFRVKCPKCKKKKPLKEIVVLAEKDKWEIKGKICDNCEKDKQKNEEIEIF